MADPLGDIFGGGAPVQAQPAPVQQPPVQQNPMMDIFGTSPAMPQAQPQPTAALGADIFGAPMSAPPMQAPTP